MDYARDRTRAPPELNMPVRRRLHFTLWILFLLSVVCQCSAGKVDVAQNLTTLQQNQRNPFISVKLSQVVIDNDVNVTCSQLQYGIGKASLLFMFAILPVGSSSGNISVSIVSAGDSVPVACYGFSLNNGRQYLSSNSTGKSGNVIVTLAPSVSICNEYIFVKGYTTSAQSFTVQLSEPAISPVIVNCFVSSESSAIANSLQLGFTQATVLPQQTLTTVTFIVQRSGQPVKVFCQAQSQNCLPADSIRAASPVISSVRSQIVVNATSIFSMVAGNSTNAVTATSTINSSAVNETVLYSAQPFSSLNASGTSISDSTSPFSSSITSVSSTLNKTSTLSTTSIASSLAISTAAAGSSVLFASSSLSMPLPTTSPFPSSCQYLFNSSLASSVNFVVKAPSITAHPSYMDYSNLGDHVSYVILDEALEGSTNLILQCRLKQVGVADIGARICGADGLPLGGASVIALSDITIRLRESQITFKPGIMYGNITIQVVRFGNQTFSQLFHAFCCAPATSEKYRGLSVSVFLWIDGKGVVPFNWNSVPGQLQRKMTLVESLDSSCPCNLNANLCDINCCCDKECSSAEINRFVCIIGAFGGNERPSSEFDCTAVWPDRTDWTPILCVVTNNSPFLGYFLKYTTPVFALSSNDFQTLSAGRTIYSFEENEARRTDSSGTIGYTYGSPVRTDIGILTVPSSIEGICSFSSIRYLMDRASFCTHKVSIDICTKDTFNALNFVLSDSLTFPSCSVPGILDGRASTSKAQKTIEYYCLASSTNYLRQNYSPLTAENSKESLFSTTATGVSNVVPRCMFDNGKTRPPQPSVDNSTNTCQNAVVDVNYIIPWNAQQINTVTARITLGNIPLATVTQSAVTYTYYTQSIVASPVVAPIVNSSLSQSSIQPTLALSTAVALLLNQSTSRVSNSSMSLSSSLRSSSNISSSLNASYRTSAASPLSFAAVATSYNAAASSAVMLSRISTINATNASYNYFTLTVKTSTVIPQKFTIDRSVIQKFTVSFKYEKSVDANASVSAALSNTSSTVVHRSGNPGYVTGKPLISRKNSTASLLMTDGILLWHPKGIALCTSSNVIPVPFGRTSFSGCSILIGLDRFSNCSELSSLVKENQAKLVKAVQVAKRGNPVVNDGNDWLDIITIEPVSSAIRNVTRPGICYDIPAHLVIEVLISEAGMRYGEPQMEISGLKIRYITETWSLNCSSGKDSGCYNNNDAASKFTNPFLKSFHLTSSVVFVKIPAVEPPRVKRSIVTNAICKYDSCLQELFYPIMDAYSSNIAEYTLSFTQRATAVAMTIIFIAFGALYVTVPWH